MGRSFRDWVQKKKDTVVLDYISKGEDMSKRGGRGQTIKSEKIDGRGAAERDRKKCLSHSISAGGAQSIPVNQYTVVLSREGIVVDVCYSAGFRRGGGGEGKGAATRKGFISDRDRSGTMKSRGAASYRWGTGRLDLRRGS